ncbi:MAG: hypothetical protein DI537_10335 [Stutzerimonas stutzeri]|nr:MAG: hypothetical protein DI537_10335 [Stutzerimonas stutzeri]
MNIFEGARRVLLVAHLLVFGWLFGPDTYWLVVDWPTHSYVSPQTFTTDNLRDWKRSAKKECDSGDASALGIFVTPKGNQNMASLCAVGMRERDLADPHFEAVMKQNFKLAAEDGQALDREAEAKWRSEIFKIYRDAAGWFFVWLLSTTAAAFAIGWIVRGFLGIPRGRDHALQKT